jgi:hypothetical protein
MLWHTLTGGLRRKWATKPLNTFAEALSAFQTAISYRFVLWLKATRPGKRITIQDLPAQLVELSEKDL